MMDSKFPNQDLQNEINVVNDKLSIKKSFGGKLSDFTDNKDRHFNQRMLKAYLKGNTQFQFGKSWKKNQLGTIQLLPDWHDVLLTDNTIDLKQIDKLLANGYNDPGKVFGGFSGNKSEVRKIIKKRIKLIK